MALPQIVLPSDLPAWLINGHQSQIDDAYAHVQMRTGHYRLRRVYRNPPEVRSVSLLLEEWQAPIFHEWFENDIQAGALAFSARVANRGPGVVWYEARFVGDPPYEAVPLHMNGGVGWEVRARLLLSGSGSVAPPVLTPMTAANEIALQGRAIGSSTAYLTATTVVELVGEVS